MTRITSRGWGCALVLLIVSGCIPSIASEPPEPADVEHTLFLIGDAGEPDPRDVGVPLESLTVQAAAAPQRSTIVFLGDNVYPHGIPEEGEAEYADARRRLEAQVLAVPSGARGIFLAGNHDWASELPYGLYAVRRQATLIAAMARGRDVRMLPEPGCPGPVTLDLGRLRLLTLDTQWWLHNYIVRDSTSRCTSNTMGDVTDALRRDVVAPGENRVVIVAGHHPLMTGGQHGGYCGIFGPFYRFAGRSQDIMSATNKRMRDSIESAFQAAPPLAYVAGHEHNLQVLHGGQHVNYILVSGAGAATKTTCAVRLRESMYTSPHRNGFMRVDILRNSGVFLRVYRYTAEGRGGLAYSTWLEPR